jgi:hypothetical protein
MSFWRALVGLHDHRWEEVGVIQMSEASRVSPSQKRVTGFRHVLRCSICGDVKSVRV